MTIPEAARASKTVWQSVVKLEEWPNHLGVTLYLTDGRKVEVWDLADCWKACIAPSQQEVERLHEKGTDLWYPIKVICAPVGTDPLTLAKVCDENGYLLTNTDFADDHPTREELLKRWEKITAQLTLF